MNDQEKAQEKGRRLNAAQDAIRAEIKRKTAERGWTVDDLARAVSPAPDPGRLAAYLDGGTGAFRDFIGAWILFEIDPRKFHREVGLPLK